MVAKIGISPRQPLGFGGYRSVKILSRKNKNTKMYNVLIGCINVLNIYSNNLFLSQC